MRELFAQALSYVTAPVLALFAVSLSAGPQLDVERAKSDAAGAVAYAALAVEVAPMAPVKLVPAVAPVPLVNDGAEETYESDSPATYETDSPATTHQTPPPLAPAAAGPSTSVQAFRYASCSGPMCRRGRLFRR